MCDAIYQIGIGVVNPTRGKPDVKAIWVNPTNDNRIPTTKGIRKEMSSLEGCATFPATMGLNRDVTDCARFYIIWRRRVR